MLPPLGPCAAARMQVRISSSVTGTSAKRRTARVVSMASNRSISASFEFGFALLLPGGERFLVVVALEGDQLERGRGVEGDVERVLDQLVDRQLGVAQGERRA